MNESLKGDPLKERLIKIFNILISKQIDNNIILLIDRPMIELLTNILKMFQQMNALDNEQQMKLVTSIQRKVPVLSNKTIKNGSSAIYAYLRSINISDTLTLKYTRAFILAMIRFNYNIITMSRKDAYDNAYRASGIKDKTTFDTLFYVAQPFMISVDASILGVVTVTFPIWGPLVAYKHFTSDNIEDPNIEDEDKKNIEKIEKDDAEDYIDFSVALAINDMHESFIKEEYLQAKAIKNEKDREIALAKLAEETKRTEQEAKRKQEEEQIREKKEKIKLETTVYESFKKLSYTAYNAFISSVKVPFLQDCGIDHFMSNIILLSILNQTDRTIDLDSNPNHKYIENMGIDSVYFSIVNDIRRSGIRPINLIYKLKIDLKDIKEFSNINYDDLSHVVPRPTLFRRIIGKSERKETKEPSAESRELDDPTRLGLRIRTPAARINLEDKLRHRPTGAIAALDDQGDGAGAIQGLDDQGDGAGAIQGLDDQGGVRLG